MSRSVAVQNSTGSTTIWKVKCSADGIGLGFEVQCSNVREVEAVKDAMSAGFPVEVCLKVKTHVLAGHNMRAFVAWWNLALDYFHKAGKSPDQTAPAFDLAYEAWDNGETPETYFHKCFPTVDSH